MKKTLIPLLFPFLLGSCSYLKDFNFYENPKFKPEISIAIDKVLSNSPEILNSNLTIYTIPIHYEVQDSTIGVWKVRYYDENSNGKSCGDYIESVESRTFLTSNEKITLRNVKQYWLCDWFN